MRTLLVAFVSFSVLSYANRIARDTEVGLETEVDSAQNVQGALAREVAENQDNINNVMALAAKIKKEDLRLQDEEAVSYSSEEFSFEEFEAVEKHVNKIWVNLTALEEDQSDDCYSSSGTRQQWVGTAPFCAASRRDCADLGMEYVRSGSHGSSCWSGTKVLCQARGTRVLKDVCNAECTSVMSQHFVGTAPFCGGYDCDCIRNSEYPLGVHGDYDRCPCQHRYNCATFGSGCTTGGKVLCVRPPTNIAQNNRAMQQAQRELSAAARDCTHRDELSTQRVQAIANAVGQVAKAAGQVATRR